MANGLSTPFSFSTTLNSGACHSWREGGRVEGEEREVETLKEGGRKKGRREEREEWKSGMCPLHSFLR